MAAVAVSSEAPTKNRAPGQQTKSKPVAPGSLHRTPKLTPAEISTIAPPVFWRLRNDFFDKLYQEQCIAYKAKEFPIAVTLPDGKVLPATAFSTTPDEVARSISRKLAEKVFVAKVDDVLWDLTRPLEESCHLELLDWDSREARNVFWHSSAHVLGHALERGLGIKLSVGPPLEEGGFFYEGDAGRPLSEADYPLIEGCVADAVSSKRPFQRLVISKADALAMFAYNPMKTTILQSKVPEDGYCTVYRCGELIDPCRGPHLPDMGRVKSFELTRCSASYFLGKSENASLQRVYGISFPKESLLKEWRVLQEEAARRDHRAIGKHQELWMWNELSPGSTFFYPHGARIYNTLVEYMRRQYRMRGFEEVITPNMYNSKLWKISGHHQKYRENLFYTQVEKEEFALKPMNCPGHCLIFSVRPRSYRELPLRIADFGVLHRNEISGALSGLIRVRRFQQDDAHIFCTPEQVRSEILGALNFLKEIYDTLGFSFTLSLSTRPADFLGTERMWAIAEAQLQDALNDFCGIPELPDPFAAAAAVVSSTEPGEKAAPLATPAAVFSYDGSPFAQRKVKRLVAEKKLPKIPFNRTWERNEGDGAFYGPKIDVTVMDALHRKHQCGTIQLDFQLPLRFNLSYVTDGERHEIHFPGEKGGPEETISGDCGAEGGDGAHCGHSAPAVTMHTLHPSVDGTMSGLSQQPVTAMKTGGHHMSAAHSLERPLDPGHARPIMIHRAIFGSLERCIAILTEHYAGKWPFWLSPRQAVVVPVSKAVDAYARSVRDSLYAASFYCDVDLSDHKLEKKIRTNQLAQYNYILVVGHEEQEKQLVNVRCRENKRHGMRSLQEVLEAFTALRDTQDRAEVFQTRAPEAAKAIASAIKLEEEVATQERKKEEEFESMEENKSILSYEPTQHLEPMTPL